MNKSQSQSQKQEQQKGRPQTASPGEPDDSKRVEGEGSYTATRRYNEGLRKSVEKGDSEDLGEEARRALEGDEGDELRRAEDEAKKRGQRAGKA